MGGETLIYPPYLYQAEVKAARKLLYIQKYADEYESASIGRRIEKWEKRTRVNLAEGQREALRAALTHGVMVLTGGPGTGKTTVVRGIIDLLEAQGLTVQLGAPTGRAAKRLSEATDRKAMTVHRMLEAQGGSGGMSFAKDEEEQLEADAIILDEVSMMDIVLMEHFLLAVPDGCHLVLVGDVDQLPAVGPGSVLKDILRSGVIPKVCLTEVLGQRHRHERPCHQRRASAGLHSSGAGGLPVHCPARRHCHGGNGSAALPGDFARGGLVSPAGCAGLVPYAPQ